MRLVAAVFVATLVVGCGQRPAAESAAGAPSSKQDGPAKTPGLEGVYCTPAEIGGFSGTVLEIKAGKFRYWFYSDVSGGDTPKYPLTGEYTHQDGKLILNNAQAEREWSSDVLNGIPVLLRPDALKIWREQRKIYDYGVLIRVEGTVNNDGEIARPSVKILYDVDKQGKEWKDPFVHGPQ
jgi:hypothetical protein